MRPSGVKLLFSLSATELNPSFLWLIEPAASCDMRLLFASNELLSVLVVFYQTPNAVIRPRTMDRGYLTEFRWFSHPPRLSITVGNNR